MKVAVYYTPQYGPSAVFTIPPDGQAPATAAVGCMTGGQAARAMSQWTAKGHGMTWADWAQSLAGSLPYWTSWAMEEVPDGSTAQQALSDVRRQAADRVMQPGEAVPQAS